MIMFIHKLKNEALNMQGKKLDNELHREIDVF